MLVIEDYLLNNALLQALYVAKFEAPLEDSFLIASSPYVADVYNRAYDAAIEFAIKSGRSNEVGELERERLIKGRVNILARVIDHVNMAQGKWKTWTIEQKREYLKILISPYLADDFEVEQLIVEADGSSQLG